MTTATTAANQEAQVKRPAERRRGQRHCCLSECLVRVEGVQGPSDWPGMVYNISSSGIGLALPFPALKGMELVIELRSPRFAGMSLRARVVRCALQEYVWFHGCQFEARLGAAELRRWLAAFRGRPTADE